MAKKKPRSHDAALFPDHPHRRAPRPHKALFVPRLLAREADSKQLEGPEQDRARVIIAQWAELGTAGRLSGQKETSLNAEFVNTVFGDALGYKTKTQGLPAYELEREYTVPDEGAVDAALGNFPAGTSPVAVIELKDADTDLDRDRSQGRSAVKQCWDYLAALPDCPWGIVSNFVTIRLYHRDKTPHAYEEFTLADLRDNPQRFREFYCLFEPGGLLRATLAQQPRALRLLKNTAEHQLDVGNKLYEFYADQRVALIEFLVRQRDKPLDSAIRLAQKLLDRIIFIAFCEDRGLLPENTLEKASANVAAFSKATNPRWQNYRALFEHVDKGHPSVGLEDGYNGGLFRGEDDRDLDALELPDEPWTTAFQQIGRYNFSEEAAEINVDVLGHLFEKSIVELERLRVGGLPALKAGRENGKGGAARTPQLRLPVKPDGAAEPSDDEPSPSAMPKSAQRKRFGIYYTPPAFTGLIVERTVNRLIDERFAECARRHGVSLDSHDAADADRLRACWRDCLEALKTLRICDPACGSGAFLIRAYETLTTRYQEVADRLAGLGDPDAERIEDAAPDLILQNNLFGVDLSQEAVEITQLALWIRSARRGKTLAELSKNIVWGNSLVADPAVDPHALDWAKAFPRIISPPCEAEITSPPCEGGAWGGPRFDCVIGNPPWERLKVQEREFFSLLDPDIAQAVSAAERRRRIAELPSKNPELHERYQTAKANAERVLAYARKSDAYPLTGRGDINTYMLFAELARKIVAPRGLVGLLTPSGIATDDTTKEFFNALMDGKSLDCLYDFENRKRVFPDVDGRFKFSALIFGGSERQTEQADFVFFAHAVEEVAPANKQRHIVLTAADMALLNPNTRTCPVFRTRRDAALTRAVYRRVPILIDHNRKKGGNPWGIRFFTMFHQTNDAEKFTERKTLEKQGFKPDGNRWRKGKKTYLPLYEAKMVQAFDHRAASVVIETDNWFRQGQKAETSLVEHQNPEFVVMPRWWVESSEAIAVLPEPTPPALLTFKNVTSPTNTRTMIAAFIPTTAVGNSAPLILLPPNVGARLQCCLLANLDSFALDYVARQKIGNVNLNFFLIEQFPMFPPGAYADKCPWDKKRTLEAWISERVLKLSCTANDLRPLAEAAGFKGSQGDGVHKWKDAERAQLRAQLDAAYFHLYGIARADVEYILATFTGTGRNEEGIFGPDETGSLILQAYDQLIA